MSTERKKIKLGLKGTMTEKRVGWEGDLNRLVEVMGELFGGNHGKTAGRIHLARNEEVRVG